MVKIEIGNSLCDLASPRRNCKRYAMIVPIVFFAIFIAVSIYNFIHMLYTKESIASKVQFAVKPMHYAVKLALIDDDNFRGESNISINVYKLTKEITFHSLHLYIAYDTLILFNISDSFIINTHTYESESQSIILHFFDELSPGTYFLHVQFKGIISDERGDGFVRMHPKDNTGQSNPDDCLYVINFRARGARRIFPYWDEPAIKPKFSITIQHPKNTAVLSNMYTKSTHVAKKSVQTSFETNQGMSIYRIIFMIYNNRTFANTFLSQNVNVLYKNHTNIQHMQLSQHIIDRVTCKLHRMMKFLQMFTNNVYFGERKQLVNENPRFILYRDENILYNKETDSVAQKEKIAYFIAYDLAYNSFGNIATPKKWHYLWLNEALSTLIGLHLLDKSFPSSNMMNLFITQARYDCLRLDNDILSPLNENIDNPSEINSFFSYQHNIKAFLLLRMLQHSMTTKLFWNGVYIYFHIYTYFLNKNDFATPNNLWIAMQVALYDSSSKLQIANAMNSWINHNGYPIINVKRKDFFLVEIKLNYRVVDGYLEEQTFYVPLRIFIQNMNRRYTKIEIVEDFTNNIDILKDYIWLTPTDHTCTIRGVNAKNWIIVNPKQIGYYRVNYDILNWHKLALFLITPRYKEIDILTRAQLIDDAYYFAMNKTLDIAIFLKFVQYLRLHEMNYIAWYPAIKAFQDLSRFFVFNKSLIIKDYIRMTFVYLLKKIGFTQNHSDNDCIKRLRKEAIQWACILKDCKCLEKARNELNLYMAQPTAYKLWPGWKEWTHCKGLMSGSANTWRKLFIMWKSNRDNKTLEYLACSENHKIIYKYLRPLPSDYTYAIMSHYHIKSFLYIVARHANKQYILELILKHFRKIKPRQISTIKALCVIINYVCSLNKLDMIENYMKHPDSKLFSNYIKPKIENRRIQIKEIRGY